MNASKASAVTITVTILKGHIHLFVARDMFRQKMVVGVKVSKCRFYSTKRATGERGPIRQKYIFQIIFSAKCVVYCSLATDPGTSLLGRDLRHAFDIFQILLLVWYPCNTNVRKSIVSLFYRINGQYYETFYFKCNTQCNSCSLQIQRYV